jgi:2-phospho-L-lactate guanylyltransferase
MIVLVPVKALDGAKSRLAVLGEETRRALVLAMLEDVLAAVRAAHDGPLLLLSSDSVYDELAAHHRAQRIPDQASGFRSAVQHALRLEEVRSTGAALVLPADLPQIMPDEVAALIEETRRAGVVLVPSADGGTSALGLRPPDAIAVAYGPDSAAEHRRRAHAAGHPLSEPLLPRLDVDIDTPDDLHKVRDLVGAATARVVSGIDARETVGPPGRGA